MTFISGKSNRNNELSVVKFFEYSKSIDDLTRVYYAEFIIIQDYLAAD
jgi:hypothetical protein